MGVQLNHTIVWSSERKGAARFLAEVLGLAAPVPFGHFEVVALDNGVTLDFADLSGPVQQQHFAFLVSEEDFDVIFARIEQRGVRYWADPMQRQEGSINRNDGGRGVYFAAPDDHLLEIITRPYGGG